MGKTHERKKIMKDENEIQLAYKVWILIAKLNDLLWDRYQEQFIHNHLKEDELLYRGSLFDHMSSDDT